MLFLCNIEKLNYSEADIFCAKLKLRAMCLFRLTRKIKVRIETQIKYIDFNQCKFQPFLQK